MRVFLHHPPGLFILFLTEMWERFSYYGMRSLLVYYMMKQLMMTQDQASHIYGLYTGFVYLTPFFGGILADRYLGQSRAVLLGATLMAVGHFMMAWDLLFIPALVVLVLGNGAFKPNVSTQVGSLYDADDPRRDRGFSIFYVGINIGAFFSPLVCGTLGEVYGWHYGFGAAGLGMVIGLLIYAFGRHKLPNNSYSELHSRVESVSGNEFVDKKNERRRIIALIFIGLVTIAFWAAYEQQGNTMALWADTHTDRLFLGWEFPASWFQSLNPALIFLITPFLTRFWSKQAESGKEPAAVMKMTMGCLLLSSAFFLMIIPAHMLDGPGAQVSFFWLFGFTLLATIGELYLSPIGLSLVTKIAPARMISMMMGVWLTASFFGNYAAGYLGRFWELMPKTYFFGLIGGVALASGVLLFLMSRFLRNVTEIRAGRPGT